MHPRDLLPLLRQAASDWADATSSIASSFGAAGSVVIVLTWIYYTACILFFGAEITKVYARKFGSGVIPNRHAVLVDDLLRKRLGLSTAMIEAATAPPREPPAHSPPGKP